MAVRIRLKRIGRIHAPFYRVVVVDQRKKRDGQVIEEVGIYDPATPLSLRSTPSARSTGFQWVRSPRTRCVTCSC